MCVFGWTVCIFLYTTNQSSHGGTAAWQVPHTRTMRATPFAYGALCRQTVEIGRRYRRCSLVWLMASPEFISDCAGGDYDERSRE